VRFAWIDGKLDAPGDMPHLLEVSRAISGDEQIKRLVCNQFQEMAFGRSIHWVLIVESRFEDDRIDEGAIYVVWSGSVWGSPPKRII
jgi:hypothetical protein